VGGAAAAGTFACTRPGGDGSLPPDVPREPAVPVEFSHGVASGDPLADRVILWTRVTADQAVTVAWEVAEDEAFARVVQHGTVDTDAARDFTVKVDAVGLAPGQAYWFRFWVGDRQSPTGRTRTLPTTSLADVTLAVTSCSNLPWGHFNAYRAIAARDDVFALVHLGDYIYEYANGTYGDGTALGRLPDPPDRECVTLDDYRRRHACYKKDAALQLVHARHPCIAVWDDHEITNDTWRGGAQNHDESEGPWDVRRKAAVQAWREWMPVREAAAPDEIHRAFRFGDLVELLMLDTRLVGRDAQIVRDQVVHESPAVADAALAGLRAKQRQLLGAAQEQWMFDRLREAADRGVAWRVLGQQVLLGQLMRPDGVPPNLDAWDGYPAARDRLFDHLERYGLRDVIALTGDIHSSWAIEVGRDPFGGAPPMLVELVTPAVSSPPPKRFFDVTEILGSHPHIRWIDMEHRGYLAVRFEPKRAVATWHLTADIDREHADLPAARTFVVPRGRAALEPG
jgi:alkaline phosphatase D